MPKSNIPPELWIFGYGSVVFKNSDIPHDQSATVFVDGYKRRFWQGSEDHRGTPQSPGRVASLFTPEDFEKLDIAQRDAAELKSDDGWRVIGTALRVTHQQRDKVLMSMDEREKNGYLTVWVPLYFAEDAKEVDPRVLVENALVYIAPIDNDSFLGFATHRQIAAHIAKSEGPSGPNLQYVKNLQQALHRLGHPDPHVDGIMSYIPEFSS